LTIGLQHHIDNVSDSSQIDGVDAPTAQKNEGFTNAALLPGERESKEVRRLVRKIDMRLLPVLATIYAFALIDRVNLPNVRVSLKIGICQT